jgi:hypothetical protein
MILRLAFTPSVSHARAAAPRRRTLLQSSARATRIRIPGSICVIRESRG